MYCLKVVVPEKSANPLNFTPEKLALCLKVVPEKLASFLKVVVLEKSVNSSKVAPEK